MRLSCDASDATACESGVHAHCTGRPSHCLGQKSEVPRTLSLADPGYEPDGPPTQAHVICGPSRPIRCHESAGGGWGRPPGPMKAKTWSVPGRSSRPSPTDGVGKWFAYPPKGIDMTSRPLAWLRP